MAAILDAFAPYVKKLIADMAEEEVSMLLGVSSEITKLESNMESVNDFLADAERRRITDKSVQRWVRKLKIAMYDATDILDLCQLEALKRRESKRGSSEEKAPGCFQPLLFCLRNPLFAHKIGNRIKELNQRLDDILKEAAKFSFINLNNYPRTPTAAERFSQRMTSEFNESDIVGHKIESDTKELVQVLIANDDNHNIKLVSIVGMGGMGKTTLAQKIFKETAINEHFKKKIWLSITQQFNDAELLRTAISHAGTGKEYHVGDQDMTHLMQALTEALSSGRFLLVMDDVWGNQAWDDVLSVPVNNASCKKPGSRVLITTRSEDLAKQMRTSFYQHHVSPLNDEDAWSLLEKQLNPDEVDRLDVVKDVGMEIIKKCDGLPLAIKVMGGLLSTKHSSKREWKDVLNSSAWSVAGLPDELDKRMYLSYIDLSSEVKQCFLYCSLFPKGINIRQINITRMWISEGFIQPMDGRSLEEVATGYYRELITRNLIEPLEGYSLNGFKCTMHDVVRSFAEFMAREESLVVVQDGQDISDEGSFVCRLSIGPTKSVSVLEWANLQKIESLRTLVINCRVSFEHYDSLISFARLRVLFLCGADSNKLVDSICQLRHLRYLHLEKTDITRLPDDINRMKFLQHIVVESEKLSYLPRNIIQLAHLRTVDIQGSNVETVPRGFSGLTNLRMLKGFPVHMDMDGGWCSLEEIGPLYQLEDLTVHGLENVSASSLAEEAMISSKDNLQYLELHCSNDKYKQSDDEIEKQEQQQTIQEVFDKLWLPTCIEHLIMDGGYFGHRLPNWLMAPATTAFKSLRYLTLEDMPCCTQLPDGLCQLPCLETLTIESVPSIKRIGSEFQASFSLASAVGGGAAASTSAAFPKLRQLELVGLNEWDEWEWTEQGEDMTMDVISMPTLERLYIENCKLRCLPPGLANSKRHALRRLFLVDIGNLTTVENFPSVVDFSVFECRKLERISGLSGLQKTKIVRCPNLEVLAGVPELDSMVLQDSTMKSVPRYLRDVNPRYLMLSCSKELCESLNAPGSSERNKISHIKTPVIGYVRD